MLLRAAADCARGANPERAELLLPLVLLVLLRAAADWLREAACEVIGVDLPVLAPPLLPDPLLAMAAVSLRAQQPASPQAARRRRGGGGRRSLLPTTPLCEVLGVTLHDLLRGADAQDLQRRAI